MLLSERKSEADKSDRWFAQRNWNNTHREARRAHALVRRAVRDGTLKRGRCVECGAFTVEAHHADYAKPLEVLWLCRRHHRALHAAQRRAAA